VLSRLDRDRSWHLFGRALESDFSDIQGGTTPEGIHLGAMAGTVDLVRRCYLGVETRDDVLWLNPCLPAELDRVDLRLRYRGHWLGLHVSHTEFEVCSEEGWGAEVAVGFRGTVRRVSPGDRHHFRFADSGGSSYDSAAHSERNPDDAEPAR
jgi:alpha,alpha-trehalase